MCKTNSFTQLETCITRIETKIYLLKIFSPIRITKLIVTVLVLNACKKTGNNTTNQTPFPWNCFWWHKRKLIGTTKCNSFEKMGSLFQLTNLLELKIDFICLWYSFYCQQRFSHVKYRSIVMFSTFNIYGFED